ncbi:MAG: ABC transporter permease [Candidatus Aminicenantaceae bacterium]
MSFNLEKALHNWKKSLYQSENMEDGYVEELESHLREEIQRHQDTGIGEEAAFKQAVQGLGSVQDLGSEYEKARTRDINGRFLSVSRRWIPGLLWSYGKLALRKLRRQKGYSLINIAGLAMGMACCILILTWVWDELSYDRFHKNSDKIFRIVTENHAGGRISVSAGSPAPIGQALVEQYPEVKDAVLVQCGWSNYFLHYEDKIFMQEKLAAVGPSFFEIFQFPFLQGDPQTALLDPASIVLTESLARKCFGEENPMGQVLQMDEEDLRVTGVISDIPRNSHLQFDYAFPAENMRRWRESQLDSWMYMQFATYVELAPKADIDAINLQLMELIQKNLPGVKGKIYLQFLTDIHLQSTHMNSWMVEYPSPGNIAYVYLFALTAVCVLLLACINFMNLATARYGTRAREVGMRKVVGAQRKDLVKQFIGESCFTALIALLFAILLVELFLPAFSVLAGKEMSLEYAGNPGLWACLLSIVLLTGFVSGSYPAFFLSSFQPSQVVKSLPGLGVRRAGWLRKILVVTQFSFTLILLIGTIVIYSQLHFIQNKDLGYNTENIITFASYGEYGRNYEAARSELLQNPAVLNVCRAFPPSSGFRMTTNVDWDGKDPSEEIRFYEDMGDYDFLDTFGLKMTQGRFYSRKFPTDKDNFVVNETAIRVMEVKDPLGKRFTYQGNTGTIIGVVKDYHGGSLHEPILPKVIALRDEGFFMCVKFRPGQVSRMVAFLESKWDKFVPGHPFRYEFVDESIASSYTSEKRIGKIFRNFTMLAVLIACLGLFGMASFIAELRTKEIGIRKILGACVWSIVLLLSKEFIKWVLIAYVIAWPLAYIAARKWLGGFAYRTRLGWELFALALVLALGIAVATVSYQAIRAATANPVDSLRYE